MKLNNLIITAAAISMTSCSLFTTQGTTVSGAKAISVNPTETVTTTPAPVSDLPDKIAGEWTIISVGSSQIESDEMPCVTFDNSSSRFYASDGCNVINGSYSVSPDGHLTLTDVLATMKYCPDVEYSAQIAASLSGAEPLGIKIDKVGHESYLRFFNSSNREIMSARKHNMDFLNGNWKIVSVRGAEIESDDATIFIDIAQLKIHGNTGCNYFNGELFISPDKSNAIDFSNLASTRKACRNMEQESAIMLALEETASAIQGAKDRVMLLSSDGKELMTISRIE